MAFLFEESSAVVKGLKLLFFSAGLISTLLMATPFLYEIFLPNLAAFWNSFRCFFSSPLYICIIINSVVLLIAATSIFHDHDLPPPRWDDEATAVEAEPPLPPETAALLSTTHIDDDDDDDDGKSCSTSTTLCQGSDHLDDCSNVNSVKETDDEREKEGDERESEGGDTMESTWKAIIGSKTKKLTKSESVPPRSVRIEDDLTSSTTQKELRKLETFNEGSHPPIRRIGGLIRRDPSVGLDELNQQVEAFIKKFNRDMRLQRQESDQRFLDMIKREL